MKIERARMRDTPSLAWVAAQAFAAESGKTGVCRRARRLYPMHLYSLALLACRGWLWHWEGKAVIAIEYKKQPALWKWLAPAGICGVIAIALTAWISRADTAGLQVLLAVMRAGGWCLVGVLFLLLPAVIPALREMHPGQSARNAAAIRRWRKTLPGQEAYKISYLAMYPQHREGLAFAKAAIEHAVPAGAALYTEARSATHQRIYARRGLQILAAADGAPTLALGKTR